VTSTNDCERREDGRILAFRRLPRAPRDARRDGLSCSRDSQGFRARRHRRAHHPGGESTTIARLILSNGFQQPLRAFAQVSAGVGTCAGAILLASDVDNLDRPGIEMMTSPFGGTRLDARSTASRPTWSRGHRWSPFHAVFIRAPLIVAVHLPAHAIATLDDGTIVARGRATCSRPRSIRTHGDSAFTRSSRTRQGAFGSRSDRVARRMPEPDRRSHAVASTGSPWHGGHRHTRRCHLLLTSALAATGLANLPRMPRTAVLGVKRGLGYRGVLVARELSGGAGWRPSPCAWRARRTTIRRPRSRLPQRPSARRGVALSCARAEGSTHHDPPPRGFQPMEKNGCWRCIEANRERRHRCCGRPAPGSPRRLPSLLPRRS